MPFERSKSTGFTLAEVLITITIIGVIAALTIPNLVSKYQEHAFKVAWKKNFQTLSQIAGKANTDGVQLLETYQTTGNAYTSNQLLMNNLKQYYKHAQTGTFWYCPAVSANKNVLKWYSKDGYGGVNSYCKPGLRLEDGTEIMMEPSGHIFFDVNGATKKPNIVGKDIFAAVICTDNRIFPAGSEEVLKHTNECNMWGYPSLSCNSACSTGRPMQQDCESGKGWGCSALYLIEE